MLASAGRRVDEAFFGRRAGLLESGVFSLSADRFVMAGELSGAVLRTNQEEWR
jgi:hypothetical protein